MNFALLQLSCFCRPTLDDLRKYWNVTAKCALEEADLPNEYDRKSISLWLYTTFFPLYDDVAGQAIEPRDLSALNITLPEGYRFDPNEIDSPGTLIGQILSNPTVLELQHTNLITNHLFKGIAKWLGTDDPTQALRMLSYFSWDLENGFFLKRNYKKYPRFEECEELETEDLCNKRNKTFLKSACKKYCDELEHAFNSEGVINEIFNLAMIKANTNWTSSAKNLLPDCTWKTGEKDCWIKAVTDLGPCFSSNYHSGWYSIRCYDTKKNIYKISNFR